MRIDVSNDSFGDSRAYSRVLLQQGRPLLDHDWNQQSTILHNQLRTATRAIYGQHGGPAGTECGFVPYVDADGKLCLRSGLYTVDGYTVTSSGGELAVPAKVRADRKYLLYLDVVESVETSATNGSVSESALPGIDLAARGLVSARVAFEEAGDDATAKIKSWLASYDGVGNPIAAPEEARSHLQGEVTPNRANQLLRFELHNDNDTWKLSYDNGFAVFEIADGRATASPTIEVGNLEEWLPREGQLVELLTRDEILFEQPGEEQLLRVTAAPKLVASTWAGPMKYEVQLSAPIAREESWFMRVWDKTVSLPPGSFTPGDYLLLPARERGTAEPQAHRPARRKAPLALVEFADGKATIRRRYQRVVSVPWRDIDELYEDLPKRGV